MEALEADDLGDLGVGVEAVEGIAGIGEGVENGAVAEAFGEGEVFGVAREEVDIREDFVHAAVLDVEHSLELGVGEIVGGGDGPVGEFDENFEGGFVVAIEIGVAEAGEDFVHGVPGDADDAAAGGDVVELGGVVGEGADEAGGGGGLAFVEIGDDVVAAFFEGVIAGGGVHHGAGAEVVAEGVTVAADVRPGLDGFPSAVDGGFGWEAGVDKEVVEETVGFEGEEVFLVALLGIFEGAVEEADFGEVEGGDARGDGVGDVGLRGGFSVGASAANARGGHRWRLLPLRPLRARRLQGLQHVSAGEGIFVVGVSEVDFAHFQNSCGLDF